MEVGGGGGGGGGRGPNDRVAVFLAERAQTRRLMNVDQVRASVLRELFPRGRGWTPIPPSPKPPSLTQVRAALHETGLVDLEGFLPTAVRQFGHQPLRTQAAWMKASDVLIGVHGERVGPAVLFWRGGMGGGGGVGGEVDPLPLLSPPQGSGLINAMFMERGSVVIDLLCPHFTELTFTTAVLSAGHHYLFLPNSNQTSGSGYSLGGQPSPPPTKCFEGSPYESSSMDCLAIRK